MGTEIISEVLGFHRLEDIREVVIGLGLQALRSACKFIRKFSHLLVVNSSTRLCLNTLECRVHMEGDTTYIFLPRTGEKSKDLLFLLGVGDSAALNTRCSLRR